MVHIGHCQSRHYREELARSQSVHHPTLPSVRTLCSFYPTYPRSLRIYCSSTTGNHAGSREVLPNSWMEKLGVSWTAAKAKSVGERLVDVLFNIHPNVKEKKMKTCASVFVHKINRNKLFQIG